MSKNNKNILPLTALLSSENYEEAFILCENFSIDYINDTFNGKNIIETWIDNKPQNRKFNHDEHIEKSLNNFCLNHFSTYEALEDSKHSIKNTIKYISIEEKMFLFLYKKGLDPWTKTIKDNQSLISFILDPKFQKSLAGFSTSIKIICEDNTWNKAINLLKEENILAKLTQRNNTDLLNALIEKGLPVNTNHKTEENFLFQTKNPDLIEKNIEALNSITSVKKDKAYTLYDKLNNNQLNIENRIAQAQAMQIYQPKDSDEKNLILKEKRQALLSFLIDDKFNVKQWLSFQEALHLSPEDINANFFNNNSNIETNILGHIITSLVTHPNKKQHKLNLCKKLMQKKFKQDIPLFIKQIKKNKEQDINILSVWYFAYNDNYTSKKTIQKEIDLLEYLNKKILENDTISNHLEAITTEELKKHTTKSTKLSSRINDNIIHKILLSFYELCKKTKLSNSVDFYLDTQEEQLDLITQKIEGLKKTQDTSYTRKHWPETLSRLNNTALIFAPGNINNNIIEDFKKNAGTQQIKNYFYLLEKNQSLLLNLYQDINNNDFVVRRNSSFIENLMTNINSNIFNQISIMINPEKIKNNENLLSTYQTLLKVNDDKKSTNFVSKTRKNINILENFILNEEIQNQDNLKPLKRNVL